MMQIRAILVDDEADALEALGILLDRYCPRVQQLQHCKNGLEALTAITQFQPDLMFLDIEMPGMNGFELLQKLEGYRPEIIFTTAYDRYAINAIKVSAMDYLLKPIDEEELILAVKRASDRLEDKGIDQNFDVLLTNIKSGDQGFQKLALPTYEGLNFVNIQDILYCEADRNYTTVQCKGNEKYVISRTLKDTAELLQHAFFFRVHQSYLVNLNYIKKYIKGSGGTLVMQDGTVIPVARARKEELMKLIYT